MTSPRFPSKLAFGSFLQYGIRGDSAEARASKEVIFRIKGDRVSHKPPTLMAELVVAIIARDVDKTRLGEILKPNATLVPTPRSAPLLKNAVWGPRTVCERLVTHGLAKEWQPLIERTEQVDKSAFVKDPGARPTPLRHYETIGALPSTVTPAEMVLVDDVVTKGATFAGAAARLMEVYPGVPIRAFAISRATSDFDQIQDPLVGEIVIELDGSKSWRKRPPKRIVVLNQRC